MPIYDPMRILAPIEVDGDITHWNTSSRYKGNPSSVLVATAGQALTAGQFVTVHWSLATSSYKAFVARADSGATYAMGYVTANVNASGSAFVHYGGINDKVILSNPAGNQPAPVWLGLNGAATLTPPPEVVGTVSQRIGTLIGSNKILFEPQPPIALQNAIGGKVIPVVYSYGALREITPTDVLPSNVGGGGAPGGATTQVQFNDGGAFAGDALFTFNKGLKNLAVGGGVQSGVVGIMDGSLSLVRSVGGGVTRLRNSNTSGDITFHLPSTIGSAGSVLTDFAGNGYLSWMPPPEVGLRPAPGHYVPMWPCMVDDVAITISPTDMIVARTVLNVSMMRLSLWVNAGPADIVVVAYDDTQYPYPGYLYHSQQMSVELGGYEVDFPLPAGAWWLGIHNIGGTDVTMRSSRLTNPFSPGTLFSYDTGYSAYGGLQTGGFGPDTPNLWSYGFGNDSLASMFMIQGA